MRDRAEIVIIGSGIAGSSIAYHLTELGKRDVLVLDQGPLISGTTSHAPGLVGQLRSSVSLTKMLLYSVALYKTLTLDGMPGYFPVGSLRLASSKDRLEELKRQASFAKGVGLEAMLISPQEAKALFPLMTTQGVEGALYLPTDGSVRAPILAGALAEAARSRGAQFEPNARVTSIETAGFGIKAVLTERGRIETNIVVAASGIWTPHLGKMVGMSIAQVPMQHQFARTAPIAALGGEVSLPNLRDPDNLVYFRQDGDRLVIGGYERDPAPFEVSRIARHEDRPDPTTLDFDAARFASLLEACGERVPVIKDATLEARVNGMEAFTPDGEFILGESLTTRGFWVACGFCAHGVSGAGGVGKMMAEWIAHGEPSLDLWHMDLRRFGKYAASKRYVLERTTEVYSTYYDILYPGHERKSARGLRVSPLYHRLSDLGASFGEKSGWERPNFFKTNERQEDKWPKPRGWAARNWSSAVGFEHQATRERVALFDESSFSKIDIEGRGALAFLQGHTGNQMDQAIGTITYTQLLNSHGGIECDLTVTRLGPERFRLVTGTAFGTHDSNWLRTHLSSDGSAAIRDVTSEYCCIGLWGPRARDLMQAVSEDDFSNEGFPYMSARDVLIGEVPALALRVTYVGELGWEVYAATEYGQKLWDTLWEAGKPLGAAAAGYRAIDSLRLEKGYRYWSADIHSEFNPYEAGLGFAVKLDKGDFKGRDALLKVKAEGITRKICCLALDDDTVIALGGEPIFADGRIVGRVTSGGYGYTVRLSLAYGYIPKDLALPGTLLEIESAGERIGARVLKEPVFDPTNARIKA